MNVCGIDAGAKPGYAWMTDGGALAVPPATEFCWPLVRFDLALVEQQTVSHGLTQHKGRSFRANHKTVPILALTAGFQLAQVRATRRVSIEPKWWRGLLWEDGASGLYGLAAEAAIRRLRKAYSLGPDVTDDEVEAVGVAAAGLRIGFANTGALLDGRKWKLKAQPYGFSFEVETPKRKARAFVRDLLAKQKGTP